jgi:cytochrome P450
VATIAAQCIQNRKKDLLSSDQQSPVLLLDLLMNSQDPQTGEKFTQTQLVNEIESILLGGYETSAHGEGL